jgi:hypothetical protein
VVCLAADSAWNFSRMAYAAASPGRRARRAPRAAAYLVARFALRGGPADELGDALPARGALERAPRRAKAGVEGALLRFRPAASHASSPTGRACRRGPAEMGRPSPAAAPQCSRNSRCSPNNFSEDIS